MYIRMTITVALQGWCCKMDVLVSVVPEYAVVNPLGH